MSDDLIDSMSDPSVEGDHNEYGALFWIGAAFGWAIIISGAWLLYGDEEANWFNTISLVTIGIVAHDIVWLIVSVGAGWLLARLIGREVPHWIRWAGWTTAIVLAMWLPLARGYGDRLGNDTILPRNYTTSILILLPVIWTGAAIYGAISRSRSDD